MIGVMTERGKVRSAMQGKFRQIEELLGERLRCFLRETDNGS